MKYKPGKRLLTSTLLTCQSGCGPWLLCHKRTRVTMPRGCGLWHSRGSEGWGGALSMEGRINRRAPKHRAQSLAYAAAGCTGTPVDEEDVVAARGELGRFALHARLQQRLREAGCVRLHVQMKGRGSGL